jgi:hypothetical protein
VDSQAGRASRDGRQFSRPSSTTTDETSTVDDAARQARPPTAAEIMRQGDRRRRRSLTRQSLGGLSAAGVVALGLGLSGSAPAHAMGAIRTAAFTLVSNAKGTATLTINNNVLFEPGTLQSDLAQDGIPFKVTVGSLCSSIRPPPLSHRSSRSRNPARRGADRDNQSCANASGNGTELR